MNRRGFLGSILVACAGPAIVRADSLMRIVPKKLTVIWAGTSDSMWGTVYNSTYYADTIHYNKAEADVIARHIERVLRG